MVKKTLREKRRYILFELTSEESFKRGEIVTGIWNSCLEFLGECGASKTSLWVHEYENNQGIVSCNTRSVDEVIMCLSLIQDIDRKEARLRIKGVSGTIRCLKQ
ncbi:MAG: ribonuclease P protein component 2 [Theionarchaea archaeon]|nr:ribonuclease P protein component 2 [Theionarchaea archaeon]MBU7037649.1 ribonuclease P protein component 2 [Theionarchaea archaeon]